MTARHQMTVDEFSRWRVFDVKDALGDFASWADADAFRKTLTDDEGEDTGPAWNQKSGGY